MSASRLQAAGRISYPIGIAMAIVCAGCGGGDESPDLTAYDAGPKPTDADAASPSPSPDLAGDRMLDQSLSVDQARPDAIAITLAAASVDARIATASCARSRSSRIAMISSGSPRFRGDQGPLEIPILALS